MFSTRLFSTGHRTIGGLAPLLVTAFVMTATPACAMQGILGDNGGGGNTYMPRSSHRVPLGTETLVGKEAPDFKGLTSEGQTINLSDFKGKIVVLEWHNPECPFVKKHYESQNMQKLQNYARSENVVWLTVNSGGLTREGYMDPRAAQAYYQKMGMRSNHYIIDNEGKIGGPYGAKTTPQIVVIDSGGYVAYTGAIDDKPTTNQEDIPLARNYVQSAIENLLLGKPASPYATQPYGCSVKYKQN